MRRAFADTSFYQALLNPRDAWHAAALRFSEQYTERIMTTEYVLIELGALMSRGYSRQLFIELVQEIQSDLSTKIVPSTTEIFS